jgi:hypothetical protein
VLRVLYDPLKILILEVMNIAHGLETLLKENGMIVTSFDAHDFITKSHALGIALLYVSDSVNIGR